MLIFRSQLGPQRETEEHANSNQKDSDKDRVSHTTNVRRNQRRADNHNAKAKRKHDESKYVDHGSKQPAAPQKKQPRAAAQKAADNRNTACEGKGSANASNSNGSRAPISQLCKPGSQRQSSHDLPAAQKVCPLETAQPAKLNSKKPRKRESVSNQTSEPLTIKDGNIHTTNETPPKATRPCLQFFRRGTCHYGLMCKFSHDPDVRTTISQNVNTSQASQERLAHAIARLSAEVSKVAAQSNTNAPTQKATVKNTSDTPSKTEVLVKSDLLPVSKSLAKSHIPTELQTPSGSVKPNPTTGTPRQPKKKQQAWRPLDINAVSKPSTTSFTVTYSEAAKSSPPAGLASHIIRNPPSPAVPSTLWESPSDLAILEYGNPSGRTSPSGSIDPSVEVTNLGYESWDNQSLVLWMDRNLSDEVKIKLKRNYRPYLERGVVPVALINSMAGRRRKGKGEFPNFMLFPAEIREIIWKMALRDTRQEVHVKVDAVHEFNDTLSVNIRPETNLPPIMRASKESYYLGTKFYELAFSTKQWGEAFCWFNFATDSLVVRGGSYDLFSKYLHTRDTRRLRHLTIPMKCWIAKTDDEKKAIRSMLCRFKHLKLLSWMAGDSKDDEMYTKDPRVIKGLRYMVETVFRDRWGKGCEVPEVEQRVIPALLAKAWGIDNLQI
jgi:hypothetical protein